MGACIFVRTTDTLEKHHSYLLYSKSRIAPLKTISIPRLKLCAAELLVKLKRIVELALGISDIQIFYWCDSTIVLSWIAAETVTWKTFVANRVSKIQNYSNRDQWRNVKTDSNPADIVSRGVTPQL